MITALLGARDGSLWIGTDAGLVHQVNGHLVTYRNGVGVISSILQDVDGEILIARTRSDGCAGLAAAIRTVYPRVRHQR